MIISLTLTLTLTFAVSFSQALIQNLTGPYVTLVKMQMQHEKKKEEEVEEEVVVEEEEEEEEEEKVLVNESLILATKSGGASLGGLKLSIDATRKRGSKELSPRGSVEKPHTPLDATLFVEAAKKEAAEKAKEALKKLEEEEAKAANTSFSRLFKLNRKEWPYLVIGVVSSMAAGVLSPAFSFLFASMISIFYDPDPSKLQSNANFYAGMLAVVGFGGFIAMTCQQVSFILMSALHFADATRDQPANRLEPPVRCVMTDGLETNSCCAPVSYRYLLAPWGRSWPFE